MSGRNRLGRRLAQERGQSIVELALVMPMLMLIVLGVLDVGRIFVTYDAVQNAAREGAFYGTFNPSNLTSSTSADPNNILWHIQHEYPSLGVTSSEVTITCYVGVTTTTESCASTTSGDTIEVAIAYPFALLPATVQALPGFGSATMLRAVVRTGVF